MGTCWSDDPSLRVPFCKILDDGSLSRKKLISEGMKNSDIFRDKLNKKYKEGVEYIEFKSYWNKFEDVFGPGSEVLGKVSFFRTLLHLTEYNNKVPSFIRIILERRVWKR